MIFGAFAGAAYAIVTYNPQEKSIRMAVDDLIKSLNWFPIRGKNGMGRIHHPAMLGQRNINLPEFFSPILNRNPRLSFGEHGQRLNVLYATFTPHVQKLKIQY